MSFRGALPSDPHQGVALDPLVALRQPTGPYLWKKKSTPPPTPTRIPGSAPALWFIFCVRWKKKNPVLYLWMEPFIRINLNPLYPRMPCAMLRMVVQNSIVQCIYFIFPLSPLGGGCDPWYDKKWVPFIQGRFNVSSFFEIDTVILVKQISTCCQSIFLANLNTSFCQAWLKLIQLF